MALDKLLENDKVNYISKIIIIIVLILIAIKLSYKN